MMLVAPVGREKTISFFENAPRLTHDNVEYKTFSRGRTHAPRDYAKVGAFATVLYQVMCLDLNLKLEG